MTNLELVQDYIVKYKLQEHSKYQKLVYMRYYLYNVLYKDGMGLSAIGRVFNRTHATIYNGLKKHDDYTSYKDKVYILYTADLANKFVKKQKIKPLKDMVLELSSMEQVEYLQTMIANHYI